MPIQVLKGLTIPWLSAVSCLGVAAAVARKVLHPPPGPELVLLRYRDTAPGCLGASGKNRNKLSWALQVYGRAPALCLISQELLLLLGDLIQPDKVPSSATTARP